jgi:hypothetical protein
MLANVCDRTRGFADLEFADLEPRVYASPWNSGLGTGKKAFRIQNSGFQTLDSRFLIPDSLSGLSYGEKIQEKFAGLFDLRKTGAQGDFMRPANRQSAPFLR